jgi:hypothetical protein
MILDNFIKIKVNNCEIKFLKEKGYLNFKANDEIYIKIKDLKKNSSRKMNCKCELCGSLNYIPYQKYNSNKKRGGIYSCKKCNNYQLKKTCLKKYGVDNPLKVEKIKEKIKKTCLKKYGVENINKLNSIKDLKIITFLKKYGVSHPMKNEEIKEKCNNARIKSSYVKPYELHND